MPDTPAEFAQSFWDEWRKQQAEAEFYADVSKVRRIRREEDKKLAPDIPAGR